MSFNVTILLVFVTLAAVTAQTFQYSRGWTNGKRDGHRRAEDLAGVSSSVERILTPCQIYKLKLVLERQPLNERFISCDYIDDEDGPKRFKAERTEEPLYEAF